MIDAELTIFTYALIAFVALFLVEALFLGLGLSTEITIGMDSPGHGASVADVFHLGNVPFILLLALFLANFGAIGWGVQEGIYQLLGHYASQWVVAGPAILASYVVLRGQSRVLAPLFKEETLAISKITLLGSPAVITTGECRKGFPAQARVRDVHGSQHFVMVEPVSDEDVFKEGATVVLDAKEGSVFKVRKTDVV